MREIELLIKLGIAIFYSAGKEVYLISPSGKRYLGYNILEAERIRRRQYGWDWEFKEDYLENLDDLLPSPAQHIEDDPEHQHEEQE